MAYTLEQLRAAFDRPLPGQAAQYKMAHAVRRRPGPPPPGTREAAVLHVLYPTATGWHFALILRAEHIGNDAHRGQIGLPGGKIEPTDPSPAAAALRETEEEIGVPTAQIELLGALTPLYIPVSRFRVHPFVGVTATRPRLVPQPSEVADIYELPLRELVDPANVRTIDLPFGERLTLQNVPYYHLQERVVWGATAMILSEWVTLLGPPD